MFCSSFCNKRAVLIAYKIVKNCGKVHFSTPRPTCLILGMHEVKICNRGYSHSTVRNPAGTSRAALIEVTRHTDGKGTVRKTLSVFIHDPQRTGCGASSLSLLLRITLAAVADGARGQTTVVGKLITTGTVVRSLRVYR